MAQSDSWMREFEDAVRLADDIAARIAERNSAAPVGSGSRAAENSRLVSTTRRKITMLGTRLDSLQSLLSNPSLTKSLNEKDLNKRQEMVLNLRSRMNQMTNSLNSSQAANRSNLLGQDGRVEPKENNRTTGLDNSGIVGLQRQIMREQDEDLLKLEETVTSTKHIALAVNEELDLHTKLLDNLDEDADKTNTRLKEEDKKIHKGDKASTSNGVYAVTTSKKGHCIQCKKTNHLSKDCFSIKPCTKCGKTRHPPFRCFNNNEGRTSNDRGKAKINLVKEEDEDNPVASSSN